MTDSLVCMSMLAFTAAAFVAAGWPVVGLCWLVAAGLFGMIAVTTCDEEDDFEGLSDPDELIED